LRVSTPAATSLDRNLMKAYKGNRRQTEGIAVMQSPSEPLNRLLALGQLLSAPAVAALAPAPTAAVALLTTGSTDPTAPLLGLVALAAWACTGWLLLAVAVTAGGRLPGAAGRTAEAVSVRIAPAAVRSLARIAVGTSVAVCALGGSAAAAQEGVSLDWPGATAPPSTAHPAVTRSPAPAAPRPAAASVVAGPVQERPVHLVTVRPGDSLWAIAERALGPRATDRRVAQDWPRWWAANRSVVGDTPDVIHPGAHLVPPLPR
jgi:hypothetical protein